MSPLLAERELLADLARAHAEKCRRPAPYRALADRVRSIDPGHGLRAERQLENGARTLRRMLLRDAGTARGAVMRSPENGTALDLGGFGSLDFTYERNLPGSGIETCIAEQADREAPQGWRATSFLFSSGMAALACVLDWTTYEFARRHCRRPALRSLTAYFETAMVLELTRPRVARFTPARSLEELFDAPVDVAMFEPVLYDWELDAHTAGSVLEAWSAAVAVPSVVVLDSTLCGGRWPIMELLQGFGDAVPELIIDLRSGLKLDQQGLELANLGIVTCYARDTSVTSWWAETTENLPRVRGVRGAAPTAEGVAALSNGFVFDRAFHQRFVDPLFHNNRRFARQLAASDPGLFRVAHPGLRSHTTEMPAPFTVLQLHDGTLEDYRALLGVVRAEALRRRLPLAFGGSFGFRGHRCEVIVPSVADRAGIFKLALGTRTGPGADGLLNLFQELAAHPNLTSLARHHPNAAPAHFDLGARPTRGRHDHDR